MSLRVRLSISVAIALLLLGGLIAWGGVDPRELLTAWRRLPLPVFLTALGIHAGVYVLRALRFHALVPPSARRPSFGRMLAITASHNLAAYVLPAKTGEASFVVYLRGVCGVPASEGVATLLVARAVDLAALSAFLSAACLVLGAADEAHAGWLVPLGLGLAAASLAILALGARSERCVRLAVSLSRALRIDRTAFGRASLARAESVAAALAQAGDGGRFARAALLSLPLWAGVFGFYAVLARGAGLGAQLGFFEAAFGSGLAVLTNLLPINGFAGFGTQEAGWVAGFGLLGVDRQLALTSGLTVHLVQLFNTCLFGVLGHLAMASTRDPGSRARGSVVRPPDR